MGKCPGQAKFESCLESEFFLYPVIRFVSYLWSSNCTGINNPTDHFHPWMLQRILLGVDLFNRLPGQNEQNILIADLHSKLSKGLLLSYELAARG